MAEASRPPFESWIAITASVVFGLLLRRLFNWVFDFPIETLDLRAGVPASAQGRQSLLLSSRRRSA